MSQSTATAMRRVGCSNALHASCERIDRNADHAVNCIDKLSP
jgi:hypothetical protein